MTAVTAAPTEKAATAPVAALMKKVTAAEAAVAAVVKEVATILTSTLLQVRNNKLEHQ